MCYRYVIYIRCSRNLTLFLNERKKYFSFSETTRKYPGLPFLNRECTQDYTIPGTDITIKKGTGIIISLLGMHHDPEYFPNPLEYKPERFSEEQKEYNPVAFMPFGEGPRHCIGM